MQVVASECSKAQSTLDHYLRLVPRPLPGSHAKLYRAQNELAQASKRISFLHSQLRKHAHDVISLTEVIKEQIELSRSFWNTVLGFLVAIYVPLSFASVRLIKLYSHILVYHRANGAVILRDEYHVLQC